MPITSAIGAPGDVARMPSGKRNEAMERISRNCLRLRGKKTTAPTGRSESLEQLIIRLGVIPTFLWKAVAAGDGYVAADAPPQGGSITVTNAGDASTPATHVFADVTAPVVHTFTVPSVKETLTSTWAGNA